MKTVFQTRPYGKSNLRRKKFHRTNQLFNFLGSSFSNGGNVRAPMQLEEKESPSLFLQEQTHHFHINSTRVIRSVRRNKLSFSTTEFNKPHPAPVCSTSLVRFKFRSQLQLLSRIRCFLTLTVENSIISVLSNIKDDIIRSVINI